MKKILVLDDDESVNTSLKELLEEHNFEVTATAQYEYAKKEFSKYTFNLAIIDLKLPVQNGEIVVKEFKEINPNCKFVIYTGSLDYTLNEDLLHIFNNDLILFYKPIIDIEAFLLKIESLISN